MLFPLTSILQLNCLVLIVHLYIHFLSLRHHFSLLKYLLTSLILFLKYVVFSYAGVNVDALIQMGCNNYSRFQPNVADDETEKDEKALGTSSIFLHFFLICQTLYSKVCKLIIFLEMPALKCLFFENVK